jgi:hypothetical protein
VDLVLIILRLRRDQANRTEALMLSLSFTERLETPVLKKPKGCSLLGDFMILSGGDGWSDLSRAILFGLSCACHALRLAVFGGLPGNRKGNRMLQIYRALFDAINASAARSRT